MQDQSFNFPFMSINLMQDGASNGTITVPDNSFIAIGMTGRLSDSLGNSMEISIISRIGSNGLGVRNRSTVSYGFSDVSAFLVANGAKLMLPDQIVYGLTATQVQQIDVTSANVKAINVQSSDLAYITKIKQEGALLTFRNKQDQLIASLDNTGVFTPTVSGGAGAPAGDPTYDSFVCDAAVTIYSAVYIDTSGVVKLASAASAATVPAIGIVKSKPNSTTAIVQLDGNINGFSGLTPGAPYYLANVSGNITGIAPTQIGSVVQMIGLAKDANTLLIDLDNNYTVL